MSSTSPQREDEDQRNSLAFGDILVERNVEHLRSDLLYGMLNAAFYIGRPKAFRQYIKELDLEEEVEESEGELDSKTDYVIYFARKTLWAPPPAHSASSLLSGALAGAERGNRVRLCPVGEVFPSGYDIYPVESLALKVRKLMEKEKAKAGKISPKEKKEKEREQPHKLTVNEVIEVPAVPSDESKSRSPSAPPNNNKQNNKTAPLKFHVFSAERAVHRAFSRYGSRFGEFELEGRNAQHFVTWCRFGSKGASLLRPPPPLGAVLYRDTLPWLRDPYFRLHAAVYAGQPHHLARLLAESDAHGKEISLPPQPDGRRASLSDLQHGQEYVIHFHRADAKRVAAQKQQEMKKRSGGTAVVSIAPLDDVFPKGYEMEKLYTPASLMSVAGDVTNKQKQHHHHSSAKQKNERHPQTTLRRALAAGREGEGIYRCFSKSSQHFAMWCVEGKRRILPSRRRLLFQYCLFYFLLVFLLVSGAICIDGDRQKELLDKMQASGAMMRESFSGALDTVRHRLPGSWGRGGPHKGKRRLKPGCDAGHTRTGVGAKGSLAPSSTFSGHSVAQRAAHLLENIKRHLPHRPTPPPPKKKHVWSRIAEKIHVEGAREALRRGKEKASKAAAPLRQRSTRMLQRASASLPLCIRRRFKKESRWDVAREKTAAAVKPAADFLYKTVADVKRLLRIRK